MVARGKEAATVFGAALAADGQGTLDDAHARLSLLAVTFAAARGCASLRLQPSVEDRVQERLVKIEAGRLEPFQEVNAVFAVK